MHGLFFDGSTKHVTKVAQESLICEFTLMILKASNIQYCIQSYYIKTTSYWLHETNHINNLLLPFLEPYFDVFNQSQATNIYHLMMCLSVLIDKKKPGGRVDFKILYRENLKNFFHGLKLEDRR